MGDLRYPIGAYKSILELSEGERRDLIREVEVQPALLRAMVQPLTPEQLATPYRPGGWTVRQVVHHLADNNMNAYIRFKRGLTEDVPVSPSYREDLWAELLDYCAPVEDSLTLLDVLHRRFATLLRSLSTPDYERTVQHATLGQVTLDALLHRFVWHNRHHMAQISRLCESQGWSHRVATSVAEEAVGHGNNTGPRGFSHVTIDVSDLETSVAFYVGILGLTLVHRGRRDVYLEWGTAWVCLQERPEFPANQQQLGVDHVALHIAPDAFHQAVEALVAAGVPIVRGPVERGGGWTVNFLDPDGTQLEFHTATLADRMKQWTA